MKLRHDEHELTRPLENDERVVEIASFIAVYRNFFKEGNIPPGKIYFCIKSGLFL